MAQESFYTCLVFYVIAAVKYPGQMNRQAAAFVPGTIEIIDK
jgi:hypothetical protein